ARPPCRPDVIIPILAGRDEKDLQAVSGHAARIFPCAGVHRWTQVAGRPEMKRLLRRQSPGSRRNRYDDEPNGERRELGFHDAPVDGQTIPASATSFLPAVLGLEHDPG